MPTDGELGYRPFPAFETWLRLSVEFAAVDRYVELLAVTKAEVLPEQLRSALRVATRYAAVDTGALEGLYSTNRGFTRTIATQAVAWQAALAQRGDAVRRSIEDQLAAYDMVLDLATGHREMSASWVRQLHEVVCHSQGTYEVITSAGPQHQALPKGVWKSLPNNPTNLDTGRVHQYAPPHDVPAEMARFVDELRSIAFVGAHPVLQTAYAHYAFVCIHPFADGNGRVARALASTYLYRRPGIPLIIFVDQKGRYLDALESADDGRFEPLISFTAQRVVEAIELIRISVERTPAGTAERALSELVGPSAGREGLSPVEVEALRVRLIDLLRDEAQTLLAALGLPAGFRAGVGTMGSGVVDGPDGYLRSPASSLPMLTFTAPPPGDAQQYVILCVFAARAETDGDDFVATALLDGQRLPDLGVSVGQIHPLRTMILSHKVTTWLGGVIEASLTILAQDSRARLDDQSSRGQPDAGRPATD